MSISYIMASNDTVFARDRSFWSNYLKGRPQVPDSFLDRILSYHRENGGSFGTVHDVGAGNGPYAARLRTRFEHVIVSDVAPENVRLAEDRLGKDGFSFRAAKTEEADDIPPGSVDMVFATNSMHFCDQKAAMEAIATQLKPGGTFACAGFGPASFRDAKVHELWLRIFKQGGRAILKKQDKPLQTIKVFFRCEGDYNVAPLDDNLFKAGAKRIHLNMGHGGFTGLLPLEDFDKAEEPNHTGPNDVELFETDEGWNFVTDVEGIKQHLATFPGASEDPALADMWREMEDLLPKREVTEGYWPAKIILATRR